MGKSDFDKGRIKRMFINNYLNASSYDKALELIPEKDRVDRKSIDNWMKEDLLFHHEVKVTAKAKKVIYKFTKDIIDNEHNLEYYCKKHSIKPFHLGAWRRMYAWFDIIMSDIELGNAYYDKSISIEKIKDFATGKVKKVVHKAFNIKLRDDENDGRKKGEPKRVNQDKISLEYEASIKMIDITNDIIKESNQITTSETEMLDLNVEYNPNYQTGTDEEEINNTEL